MHEIDMFIASLGIGLAIASKFELRPLFAGLLCGGLHSLLTLLGY